MFRSVDHFAAGGGAFWTAALCVSSWFALGFQRRQRLKKDSGTTVT